MMKCLITGVTGFVGSHLAEFLLARDDVEVFGIERWRSKTENIEDFKDKIILHECDMRDASSVRKVIEQVRPDRIFHLAAQSFVPVSWQAPAETLTTNIIGQLNIFEAVRAMKEADGYNPFIQIAGSSEEYGMVYENETPITETNPLRPLSPYGVSKVGQDLLGYQYYKSYGLNIICTRGFNHSVSKWTPVILKDEKSGLVDIKYISELRKYKPTGYMGGKLSDDGTVVWDMKRYNLYVWADNGWTKIYHLSCHPIRNHRLLRIASRGGIVEITDNHSIIGYTGKAVSAKSLKKKDRIKLVDLPNSEKTYVDNEIAWFYGFFAAEGCCTGGRARVYNQNRKLLERCQEILLKYFMKDSYFMKDEKDGTYRLCIRKPFDFAQRMKKEFYAFDGNKKVPQIILNANKEAKLEFLRGFNLGDGLQKGAKSCSEFKNFKTKSKLLAMGLCYLTANTTGQRFTLHFENRNEGYFSINLNSNQNPQLGRHLIKESDEVIRIEKVPYEDEVWDFETEEHVFHGGVGGNLVHNTGPRRGEVFVCSDFARQIALIEKGKKEPVINVGNLEARRDFTDVRDMVRGYWMALEKGEPGKSYNICSGKDYSIQQVLDILLSLTDKTIEIKQDPKRMRPSDVPILLGDNTKFCRQTGWQPEIPFEQTVEDLLNYWRQRV